MCLLLVVSLSIRYLSFFQENKFSFARTMLAAISYHKQLAIHNVNIHRADNGEKKFLAINSLTESAH